MAAAVCRADVGLDCDGLARATAVAIGAGFASRFGEGVRRWQPKIRIVTGTVLLLLGLYLIARDTLGLLPT
ncbi:MAG: hypothetical protein ACJAQZ_001072 [Planctomycetota bacterium]